MAIEKDQEFVEFVARAIVEKPEAVLVKRSVDEMGVLLELSVDKEDMGVVIGKEGRTAKSIRTLLRVLGAKNDARVNLKVVEPEGSEGAPVKKEEEPVKIDVESTPETPAEEVEETTVVEPVEEVEETEEEEAVEPVEETPEEDEDEDEDRPMADLEI